MKLEYLDFDKGVPEIYPKIFQLKKHSAVGQAVFFVKKTFFSRLICIYEFTSFWAWCKYFDFFFINKNGAKFEFSFKNST